jgi:hypothetical protein
MKRNMNMNCRQFNHFREYFECLDEYLRGRPVESELRAAVTHLRACAACQRRLKLADELRAALRDLPVPAPRPGFFGEALARAQAPRAVSGRRWQHLVGAALAASLVLGLGLGWLPNSVRTPSETLPGVTIALRELRTVHLALSAERDLKQATLNIALPQGIEIQGFPGQRDIRWQTDLARGVNMLALPLVAVSAHGGALVARLEHGDRSTEFTVKLQVNDAAGAGARLESYLTREPCCAGFQEVNHAQV